MSDHVKGIDRAAKRALDPAIAVPMLFLAAIALLLMSLAVRAEDGTPAGATTCAHSTTGISWPTG
jgi:lipopolysaccharide/colanic/teichoic acid biosynthesis glycosyltransferase